MSLRGGRVASRRLAALLAERGAATAVRARAYTALIHAARPPVTHTHLHTTPTCTTDMYIAYAHIIHTHTLAQSRRSFLQPRLLTDRLSWGYPVLQRFSIILYRLISSKRLNLYFLSSYREKKKVLAVSAHQGRRGQGRG